MHVSVLSLHPTNIRPPPPSCLPSSPPPPPLKLPPASLHGTKTGLEKDFEGSEWQQSIAPDERRCAVRTPETVQAMSTSSWSETKTAERITSGSPGGALPRPARAVQ